MPNANITVNDVLKQLEALGDEKVRAHNTKFGAGANQCGAKLGDIRALAKKIKSNHELGKALWKTGNVDAQFLATLDRIQTEMGNPEAQMDDEFLSCRYWNPLPQASQTCYRSRRDTGNLSRLPGFQGLHLSVRPDLDQRNGPSAKVNV